VNSQHWLFTIPPFTIFLLIFFLSPSPSLSDSRRTAGHEQPTKNHEQPTKIIKINHKYCFSRDTHNKNRGDTFKLQN
jgi:hypothetical protein